MLRFAARNAIAIRPRVLSIASTNSRIFSSTTQENRNTVDPSTCPKSLSSAAIAASPSTRTSRFGNGILARFFNDRDGQNPILSALGYYSRESIALGAATSVYKQLRKRAESAARALCKDAEQPFTLRFEMLSVHVYLTLRRLRREKGSTFETDCKTMLQCVFDVFWTDVRNRMLMKEEGLKLIASGKWVKECEQMFFGMALAFDEAWEDKKAFRAAIERNITSVRDGDVDGFFRYMWSEKERLDAMPMETFLSEKEIWTPSFKKPDVLKQPL